MPARPTSVRREVLRFALPGVVALVVVVAAGVGLARSIATEEARRDAEATAELVARTVIEPNLTPALIQGDEAALAALDAQVRAAVMVEPTVTARVWAEDGRIVYSDKAELIGDRYELDEDDLEDLRSGGAGGGDDRPPRGATGVTEPATDPIRVLVVDDHAVVRDGLELLLGRFPRVSCVGTAADGSEAVSLVDELRPDVVLMDLSMPGTDGIEATRQVRSSHPEVAVLVLTTFADDRHVMAAVDAGAVGYLLKDSGPEQLLAGIEAAARGESPLDPRVAGALMTSRREAAPPEVSLTAREREVLALVVEGMANKQIARRLGISEKTVKAHLTSVFAALGVSDRTQAALWAERHPDRLG